MARILETCLLGKKRFHNEVWALRDINFKVEPGESLGIVGSNGAGKSTILKILTGTSAPTTGAYALNGKVSSLLELGAGFHPDFTGKDNIFMNAAILGFSKREIRKKYDEIVHFSELGDFIGHPVKTYSTGMVLRLGFSVSIAVKPEILIIDEILGVGDQHFQKKCIDKIYSFRTSGKTILFVSHNLFSVRQICDKAIWLKKGRIEMAGDPITVTNEYDDYERSLLDGGAEWLQDERAARGGKRFPKIDKVLLTRMGEGEVVEAAEPGDDLELKIWYKLPDPTIEYDVGIACRRADGIFVFGSASKKEGHELEKTGFASVKLPNLKLLSGEYAFSAYILDETGLVFLDQRLDECQLKMSHSGYEMGIYKPEHSWAFHENS